MRPTKTKRPKRPKTVQYVLIPPDSDIGQPMYERLTEVIDEHHEELSRLCVRIALAWATSWKPDVDGRLPLGRCRKASDLDRELAPYDFVILLNREFWLNPRVTDLQRQALLDHELMHAAVAYDENGDPKVDERGRTVYRLRKHDLEEFEAIAARYGCWKKDIESFAEALGRAERRTQGWVGYAQVHAMLQEIGVKLSIETVASWPVAERREVLTWAMLRQAAGERAVNVAFSPSAPPCLAAAVRAPADGPPGPDESVTH